MSKKPRHADFLDRLDDYSQTAETALQMGPRSREIAKRLTGGTLAIGASAAGLTMAGSSPAEAVIIHQTIPPGYGSFGLGLSPGLLLMEGTLTEFGFGYISAPPVGYPALAVRGAGPNTGVHDRTLTNYGRLAGLSASAGAVPTSYPPNAFTGFFTSVWGPYPGSWTAIGQQKYFAFTFQLDSPSANAPAGTQVFGWGQVRLNLPSPIPGFPGHATLIDYAYEDSGAPIHVGDTVGQPIPEANALALFALGAAGVLAYRKRKKKAE